MKDLKTNDVDRARVDHAAADPWLRLSKKGTPGYQSGSNRTVHRYAGERSGTLAAQDPLGSVTGAIASAVSEGWTVFGVECGPTTDTRLDRGVYQDFRIGLQKDSGSLDHAVVAVFAGDVPRPGLGTVEPQSHSLGFVIVAYVPHHADKGWPKFPALTTDIATSCIGNANAPVRTGAEVPTPDGDIARGQLLDANGVPVEPAR